MAKTFYDMRPWFEQLRNPAEGEGETVGGGEGEGGRGDVTWSKLREIKYYWKTLNPGMPGRKSCPSLHFILV